MAIIHSVLAKSMKKTLAPQDIEHSQVVVHYHYHYLIDGQESSAANPEKREGLRRVRSYEKEYLLQKYKKNS